MASTYDVSGEEALRRAFDLTYNKFHVFPRANITFAEDTFTGNTSTAAYTAGDVVSSASTTGTGLALGWEAIARADNATGSVVQAQVTCSTTGQTARLTLYLFHTTPTCMLDDNVANTAPLTADIANYLGKIDFPALDSLGTGESSAVATPSTTGNLPLYFQCASAADDIYGVMVTRDAIDSMGAAATWRVRLWIEQY